MLAGLGLAVLGTLVGSTGLENLWGAVLGGQGEASQALAHQVVWDIRLPRTLGAWAAGALLGLAGAVAQGLFRNPLADPYLLGSASGASLGVALALVGLGATSGAWVSDSLWLRLGLTGAAFAGAVLAVLLTLALARGVGHTLRLLLAGVVVGMVLGALTSLLMVASPQSLQAMQVFMLGSTSLVGWPACGLMAGVWLASMALVWRLAHVLDGLSLGEATALSLGLPLAPLRALLVAVLALATGTAVAQTGLIAFVGLAAPHLVRAWVQVRHRPLMLLASLMGGALLALADLLARGVMAPQELPVGLVTAALGGVYLLWLLQRGRFAGRGSA
jgi:iron complex transport system permease protein